MYTECLLARLLWTNWWLAWPQFKSRRGVASNFGHMTKNQFVPFQVVGVADPRKFARTKLQQQHQIANKNIFEGQQKRCAMCITKRHDIYNITLICTMWYGFPLFVTLQQSKYKMEKKIQQMQQITVKNNPIFCHFSTRMAKCNWKREVCRCSLDLYPWPPP